jgi:PKHD-type hydroxylase
MFVCLAQVLTGDELAEVVRQLADGNFVDGRATASDYPSGVKHNLQLDRLDRDATALDQIVITSLTRNEAFRAVTLAKRILPPIFSRYVSGMHYDAHVDSAIMGFGQPLRTDFSITIFLTPPSHYDGGELIIESPFGEEEVKLGAGDAVIYAATSVHRVAPVTRGERLAAVTWVQSFVRDPALREILYDLYQSIGRLRQLPEAASELTTLVKARSNLLRFASDP